MKADTVVIPGVLQTAQTWFCSTLVERTYAGTDWFGRRWVRQRDGGQDRGIDVRARLCPPDRWRAGRRLQASRVSPARLLLRRWRQAGLELDSDAVLVIWRSPGQREGLVHVSETYTAVYERDGETWVVEIAEEPRVHSRCPSLAEARGSIRDALARWLNTDSERLRIVDDFRLPAQIRTAQEAVKATRTDNERAQLMASMTDSRSAMKWAEELGIAMRDPVTVQALLDLGDKEVSIDTFCHTITMVEELSRLSATGDRVLPDGVLEKEKI